MTRFAVWYHSLFLLVLIHQSTDACWCNPLYISHPILHRDPSSQPTVPKSGPDVQRPRQHHYILRTRTCACNHRSLNDRSAEDSFPHVLKPQMPQRGTTSTARAARVVRHQRFSEFWTRHSSSNKVERQREKNLNFFFILRNLPSPPGPRHGTERNGNRVPCEEARGAAGIGLVLGLIIFGGPPDLPESYISCPIFRLRARRPGTSSSSTRRHSAPAAPSGRR